MGQRGEFPASTGQEIVKEEEVRHRRAKQIERVSSYVDGVQKSFKAYNFAEDAKIDSSIMCSNVHTPINQTSNYINRNSSNRITIKW